MPGSFYARRGPTPDNSGVIAKTAFPAVSVPVAPSPQGARSYSRSEILEAGRDTSTPIGGPWSFVPLAIAALGAHPDDHEVRFLLALSYARLGLKTPAAEQIQLLGNEAQSDPGVASLVTVLGQLPQDQLSIASLAMSMARNLDALASRAVAPVDLRPRVNAWRLLAGRLQWFRTRDGNVVCRNSAGEWKRWGDLAGEAAGFVLPHVKDPREYSGGVPGYVIEGLDPPFVFKRVYEQTAPPPGGSEVYRPRISVLQVDELEFLSGLAIADLSSELADERVRVFVGKDGVQRWVHELEALAAAGIRVAAPSISLATLGTRVNPAPEDIIHQVCLQQARQHQELGIDVARLYAGRELSDIAATLAKPTGVRVLIPTCRYSTFIKHAAADLAHTLSTMGHNTRVLIEPDAHSHLTNVAFLREIAGFAPDVIVQINYTRANLGNLAPKGLVWATWVQDSMPHLFEKSIGAAQARTDFLVGNLRDDLFQFFGYPRARGLVAPMIASEHKFHDAPITHAQRERFACDLALVSHHSQTPEAMHRVKLQEARNAPWLVSAIEELFPKLKAFVESPVRQLNPGEGVGLSGILGPVCRSVENMCVQTLRAVGAPSNEHGVSKLMTLYAHPMLDRLLRHQTLSWAAQIAESRSWSFKLFGKGWESHPTLSRYAQGELAHGEDLRACYQAARAHLHISAHTIIHQRVFECALSGGVPLCRLQGDDLISIEFQAAARALIDGVEPTTCEPYQILELGYRLMGLEATSHERARAFNTLLRPLDLPEREILWLSQVQCERARRTSRFAGDEFPITDLLGGGGSVLFADAAGLEKRLAQCVEDDAHRARVRDSIVAAAKDRVTYEGFARRLLAFMSRSLADPSPSDDREWFDGRERKR